MVVPAVVPPANTMTPIPNPTLVPPNTALTMTFPVSTCQDSVKLKNTEIRTVATMVKYILRLLKNLYPTAIKTALTTKLVIAGDK